MLTTHITEIAGLPVSFTQPVCVDRTCHIEGHVTTKYRVHTSTTASWELTIGDFTQKMNIQHLSNSANLHPFLTVADIAGYESIIQLGNTIGGSDRKLVTLISEAVDNSSDFFKTIHKERAPSLGRDIDADLTSDDVAKLAAVLMAAYKYVTDTMVKINFSDIRIICEADYGSEEDYVTKSFSELADLELIWDVESPDDVKRKNRKPNRENILIRDEITSTGNGIVLRAYFNADHKVLEARKDLIKAKRDVKENEALVAKNEINEVQSVELMREFGEKFKLNAIEAAQALEDSKAELDYILSRINTYTSAMRKTNNM